MCHRNQRYHRGKKQIINVCRKTMFVLMLILNIDFYGYFTGYKRYPMYVSPITERIRKRKAFADTELESNNSRLIFAIPSPSSVGNLSSQYAQRTMPTMPTIPTLPLTMHLSSVIDYNTIQQSMITNDSETADYLPTTSPSTMDNYRLDEHSCSPNRIRIIDDAKLSNMNRHNNESLIYSPLTNEPNNHFVSAKPKLSFSIESIIGIK